MSDSKGAAIDEKLDEILIPDDDCFKVPGQHCGSCLADFEDSSYSDMRCCDHTKWRDEVKQAILAILAQEVNKGRIEEWEKMVEFMTPPEMHPGFKWPCSFCGLAPLMFDNERLKELKRKAGLV